MHGGTDRTSLAHLNLRGLHCPAPIIRCRAALQRLAVGESLQVTTDTLDATRDLLLLLKRGGARYLGWRHDTQGFHFLIQKQAETPRPLTKPRAPSPSRHRLRAWLRIPSPEAC